VRRSPAARRSPRASSHVTRSLTSEFVVPVGRDEHADGGAHADDPAARDRGEEPARQQAVSRFELS
jgi:hypothetical protein